MYTKLIFILHLASLSVSIIFLPHSNLLYLCSFNLYFFIFIKTKTNCFVLLNKLATAPPDYDILLIKTNFAIFIFVPEIRIHIDISMHENIYIEIYLYVHNRSIDTDMGIHHDYVQFLRSFLQYSRPTICFLARF